MAIQEIRREINFEHHPKLEYAICGPVLYPDHVSAYIDRVVSLVPLLKFLRPSKMKIIFENTSRNSWTEPKRGKTEHGSALARHRNGSARKIPNENVFVLEQAWKDADIIFAARATLWRGVIGMAVERFHYSSLSNTEYIVKYTPIIHTFTV